MAPRLGPRPQPVAGGADDLAARRRVDRATQGWWSARGASGTGRSRCRSVAIALRNGRAVLPLLGCLGLHLGIRGSAANGGDQCYQGNCQPGHCERIALQYLKNGLSWQPLSVTPGPTFTVVDGLRVLAWPSTNANGLLPAKAVPIVPS